MNYTHKILIIAGSDSGGGAGIQGDIKTIMAHGGYTSTAITALTSQNTQGVSDIYPIPADFVRKQIKAVLSDIGADAIKTGMLLDTDIIEAVADELKNCVAPIIIDPVMTAKGGQKLLKEEAIIAIKENLMPLSYIVTPNIPEAEILCGKKINNVDDMQMCAKIIMSDVGTKAVLIKGGHMHGDKITDVLVTENETHLFEGNRIDTNHTHGTGCTLASAIASGIARKMPLYDAVKMAREYVHLAIKTSPEIGNGAGPLNHACNIESYGV